MSTRNARVRIYAVQRKRVTIDPIWSPDGSVPVDWLLHGVPKGTPRPGDEDVVQDAAPGLENVTIGLDGTGYMPHPDEVGAEDPTLIYGHVVQHDGIPITDKLHLRFWEVRRQNLPSLHNFLTGATVGIETQIDVEHEGIAEAVDYVLYPDQAMAAVVFNRRAPSRNLVQSYLEKMTGVHLRFVPLNRHDALDLVDGSQVNFVETELAVGHLEQLGRVDGGDIVTAAQQLDEGGIQTITVGFSTKRPSRSKESEQPPASAVWRRIKPQLQKLIENRQEGVKKIRVGQRDTGDVLDLLDQHIGYEIEAEIMTGRTVTASAAFDAATAAYAANLPSIGAAVNMIDSKAHNMRDPIRERAAKSQRAG